MIHTRHQLRDDPTLLMNALEHDTLLHQLLDDPLETDDEPLLDVRVLPVAEGVCERVLHGGVRASVVGDVGRGAGGAAGGGGGGGAGAGGGRGGAGRGHRDHLKAD